jgi:glycosyltransferase involved in cell wall biosynthesis
MLGATYEYMFSTHGKSTAKFIIYSRAGTGMRTVTVGIPAYNEERNIVNLLHSLERQPLISQVIVSDDSSDRTLALVRDFAKSSPLDIVIFHHEARRGAAAAWNEILHKASGEIVVLYDADIIAHPSCTEQLATRILEKTALCASNSQPVQVAGIAGRATAFISSWLRSVRQAALSQYTVMGRALAIDAEVGRKIQIPTDIIAIDLYLQCKVLEMGLDVTYNDDAILYFRPPGKMQELASQVVRSFKGHKQIKHTVSRLNLGLPLRVAFIQALKNAVKDPIGAISTMIGYALTPYYISRLENTDSAKWHTVESSKTIDYERLKARF